MGRWWWCSLDLEKHFGIYKAYHGNPVNVFIHGCCVWPIFFTALLFLYFTPPPLVISCCSWLPSGGHYAQVLLLLLCGGAGQLPLVFNLGFVVAAVYALLYISMDRRAGFVAGNLCMLCWVGSCVLGSYLGFSLAWKVVVAAQSFCWILMFIGHGVFEVVVAAQSFCWILMFIGHGVFEGGTPAILNNSSPAPLTAPFFVLLEVMQKLFGYEPYPGFHAGVQARIEAERKTWSLNKDKNS